MIFGRKLLVVPALVAATAGPYLMVAKGPKEKMQRKWTELFDAHRSPSAVAAMEPGAAKHDATGEPMPMPSVPAAPQPVRGSRVKPSPLVETPVCDLNQVLRLDVSQHWIMGRWPRVTTTLADPRMEGLRVPLVTGTNLDDVAGSLTYFFDQQHQVRRIQLEGYTGDASKLVAVMTERFQLRQIPTLDAGLYLSTWNGRPTSVLHVSYANVVRGDLPSRRYRVVLEINRPTAFYGLSEEFQTLLDRQRKARRW